MELDHLHIHELRAGLVGQGDAVAGAAQRRCSAAVDPAEAAGRQYHRPGADVEKAAFPQVIGDDAVARPVRYRKGLYDGLVVGDDAGHEELLVEGVQNSLAGNVPCKDGPRMGCAGEFSHVEPAIGLPAERRPHRVHPQDRFRGLSAEDLHGGLFVKVIACLDRVRRKRVC